MKRRLMCLLLLMMLALPVAAQAFSLREEDNWNKVCEYRTTRDVTLYRHYYTQEDWYGAEEEEAISAFEPIGTLPAGKYISVIGYALCGKRPVLYWDGGKCSAWIDVDAYVRDTVIITSATGRQTSIPGNAWGDVEAVRYFLREFLSDAEVEAFIDGMQNQSVHAADGSGEPAQSIDETAVSDSLAEEPAGVEMPAGPVEITPEMGILMSTPAADGMLAFVQVQMVQPGLMTSIIRLGDEEQTVPTASLTWYRGEAEYALGIIQAPKSGVANLWENADGKTSIAKLKAGQVVLVLEKGDRFTKVRNSDQDGYVLTSTLYLINPPADIRTMIAKDRVMLRLEAKGNSRELILIPKGAAVHVMDVAETEYDTGDYVLVEYEGVAGYVRIKDLAE